MPTKKELKTEDILKSIQEEYNGIKLCFNYYSFLIDKFKENINSENLVFIAGMLSYHMQPNKVFDPFSPFSIMGNKRWSIPEDLTDSDIEKLEANYTKIRDNELKARIADVLWLKRKGIKYAYDAIKTYVESAKNLRNDKWSHSIKRIERAFRLSLSLKKGGEKERDAVLLYIKEIFETINLGNESVFLLRLSEFLVESNYLDKKSHIPTLEKLLKFFIDNDELSKTNNCLEVLAKYYDLNSEPEKGIKMKVQIAENFVKSKDLEKSCMGKGNSIQKAIGAYREIGNYKERINELREELLEIQKGIPAEMQTISIPPTNISESIDIAVNHVRNLSKEDALLHFIGVTKPTDTKKTFEFVKKNKSKFVHTFLANKIIVNDEGKTIAKSPPSLNSESNYDLFPDLVDHMGMSWSLSVMGRILPAKDQLMLEHNISEKDIIPFIQHNPLIRPSHEDLFLQGILYGFRDQWELAGSILAIQFEDSLRYILTNKGVLTSNLKENFTQEERGTTLFFKNYSKELKEIFKDDIFYELKALLVKDENGHGYNLRNKVAHGIMSYNEFYNHTVIYLWWLILRLILIPKIKILQNK